MTTGFENWLQLLADEPETAVEELLLGYADISPFQRLDAPDAAVAIVNDHRLNMSLKANLSFGISAWLERRRVSVPPVSRPKLQRAVREICEAFEIVALCRLTEAAVALRLDYMSWSNWTSGLVLSDSRDPMAELWRTLALTQGDAEELDTKIEANGLEPVWYSFCRLAGSALPAKFLQIGLLGLRRLPVKPTEAEIPWLAGLAQWATATQPRPADFTSEWLALKSLYPRGPDRWRRLVSNVLSASNFASVQAPAWWSSDRDFQPLVKGTYRRSFLGLRSPSPEDYQKLAVSMKDPIEILFPKIEAFIKLHKEYVAKSGDAAHLVIASSRLGSELLRVKADHMQERFIKANEILRSALDWDMKNAYLWVNYARSFSALQDLGIAEKILWDRMRRYPDSVMFKLQLASILSKREGREYEAETLLRAAIEQHPSLSLPYTQLAAVIANDPERLGEAEALLRAVARRFPNELGIRQQLGSLIARMSDRSQEADDVFQEAIRDFPNAEAAYASYVAFLRKRGRYDEASKLVADRAPFDNSVVFGQDIAPSAEKKEIEDFDDLSMLGALSGFTSGHQADGVSAQPAQIAPIEQDRRASYPNPTNGDPLISYVIDCGALYRSSFLVTYGSQEVAKGELEQLRLRFEQGSKLPYAELLAARYVFWEPSSEGLPSVAAAFEYALSTEDLELLNRLAQGTSRLEALVKVARALLGDQSAADAVKRWSEHKLDDEGHLGATLRRMLRPFLCLIESGHDPRDVLASRKDEVVRALRSANEISFGFDLAA